MMLNINIPPAVNSQLRQDVEEIINKTGIFARVFSRIKSSDSLNNKFLKKNYKKGERELQDLFGVRVVLYFKDEWEKDLVDSRTFNGIYATLETCDWAILQLFEERALKKCADNQIVPLIINKFRLRFEQTNISEKLETIICMNSNFYSILFRFNREKLIEDFYYSNLPVTIDNLIYIVNYRSTDSRVKEIINYTPTIVINKLEAKMISDEKQYSLGTQL